ncbi:hypothetical protein DFH09DRAFT_1092970 [Mycena vulgaris]|nr:hypothetical protein DFH09DRAFT_1092970 [Mycena vulgaris]
MVRWPSNRFPIIFVKETLRIYPAEPLSEQIAVEDTFFAVDIRDYDQLRRENHEAADPERALHIVRMWPISDRIQVSGDSRIQTFCSLSFFSGPRVCLGRNVRSVMEMQVLMCELVSKFSFSLPENDGVRPRVAVTLMPVMRSGKKGSPLGVVRFP